jgi:hypothetical protein
MPDSIGWARIWRAAKRDDSVTLRQGAWYPVLRTGATRVVLDVSGRQVAVSSDALEIRPRRPDRFTVVYRTLHGPNPARGTTADVGVVYAVCPTCSNRVWIPSRPRLTTSGAWSSGGPESTTCKKCGHTGTVAWWETDTGAWLAAAFVGAS